MRRGRLAPGIGALGAGLRAEAGRAALAFGFGERGLDEIVSFTSVTNRNSRRVMEKLGMTHDPEGDFDHPGAAEDSPLRAHVLYRLAFGTWIDDPQGGRHHRHAWRR